MSSKPTPKPAGKPTAPAAKAPPYKMPAVHAGDVVLWNVGIASETNESDVIALVTAVNTETVSVAVLHPGTYNFDPLEGVRHAEHPDREAIRSSEVGTWRHRPGHAELLDRLEAMEDFLEPAPPAAPPAA